MVCSYEAVEKLKFIKMDTKFFCRPKLKTSRRLIYMFNGQVKRVKHRVPLLYILNIYKHFISKYLFNLFL